MALRILWDKYEAIILLEAWLQVKAGIPKLQMVNLVSYQLRLKAINQGIEIDDIFRNTNGISFQLTSMASAYEMIDMRKPASKLFKETVELYRTDSFTYQKLKEEAMKMVVYSSKIKDNFSRFLYEEHPKSATTILDVIGLMENFAISTKALSHSIFEDLTEETIAVLRKKVLNHKFFIVKYKKSLSFAEISLQLLTDFIREVPDKQVDENSDRYKTILIQEFGDGYCIGDYMHRMRFYSAYEERYGATSNFDMEIVENCLKSIGQVRDNRIFYSDCFDGSLLSSIYEDIKNVFDNGATAVYYEYLYERYTDRLGSEMRIYSADTLRTAIQNDNNFPKEYRAMKTCIKRYGVEADSNEEIRKVLQSCHVPVTFEEIHAQVPHIPMYRIKQALVQINDAAYVDEGTYFYAPNFYIFTEEKIALIHAVRSAIFSKGFLVAKDLRELFRSACPSSATDSEYLKDHGIRNILKVLLRDEFEFSSSVITEKGEQLDYGKVFQNYAADRERLTLNELLELKKELGSTKIYWDSIFKEMIRISATEFVRKGTVVFDVAAVDIALEEIYPDEYTPLKDITLFLSLPPASVRWNGFLLESFLREYSEKFRLIQFRTSQNDYFGVMLKRTSNLESYNDVAADMLARNHSWSDEKSALQLLKVMNFQQSAKNGDISVIIKAAKQKRLNID